MAMPECLIEIADECRLVQAGLSTKAYNALRRGGYRTVGAVRAADDADLLDIRSLGLGLLAEIREKLGRAS